ncbi:MAG: DUF2306 domain-containing protein [Bacteroidetes bacterium]|nr:MAG: DUF2306 domain-containing protein [Bacteroidota bacterium]
MLPLSRHKTLNILLYLAWAVSILLACYLVYIAWSYFDFDRTKNFLITKQSYTDRIIWLACFYIHLFFGGLAIVSGLPLFFSKLIPFQSSLHRWMGRIYVFSILLFAGPTGLYLSFFAEGGAIASIGFILMSLIWMISTFLSVSYILKGNVNKHYHWIIRSFCFSLSGVTLRILSPIGSQYLGLNEELNFMLTAYVPWILHLLIGELLVKLHRHRVKLLIHPS